MAKQPLDFIPPEGKKDFDNLSVDYKLKLIAYQDEIFRAKKKLQESDVRMNELQTRLDNYLRNKENQLAEIMFTAHTNAQRIEAQARSQVQFYLDEMELELQRKQREIEIIEDKTSQFDQALVTPSEPLVAAEKATYLTVVEGSAGATETDPAREPVATEPESAPPAAKKQRVAAKKTRSSGASKKAAKAKGADQPPEPPAELEEAPEIDAALPLEAVEVVNLPSFEPLDAEVALESVLPDAPVAETEEILTIASQVVESEAEATLDESAAPLPVEEIEQTWELDQEAELASLEDIAAEVELPSEDSLTEPEELVAPAAARVPEINERMQLDAFIDVRYFSDITGSKELYHHALQVTIEVEVPPDNYSVRYTKVSSDVVSTLMKYDNVVLNDLYPFNFVAPNPNSIATYFFNLLDDMLAMMDLHLHKMTMTEFPDMRIEVDQRNVAFDNMLHKGEDMFEDIRQSLPACVEVEPRDNTSLKGTLSKLLKKRN